MNYIKKRYISISDVSKIPLYFCYIARCFRIFKQPVLFIANYVAVKSPKEKIVCLRNGFAIHLSNAPEDVVSLFLIFAKREYGSITKDGLVLDVGANIGAFSLYACMNGAKRVYAFEPNGQAYDLLCKNISTNNLSDMIFPRRVAISSEAGTQVKFPVNASPQNKIMGDDAREGYELVNTTTLKRVLSENRIYSVDLLKLDCQGMEYEIIESLDKATADKLHAIKMEYHHANEDRLISVLGKHNLHLVFKKKKSELLGNLWFSKREK